MKRCVLFAGILWSVLCVDAGVAQHPIIIARSSVDLEVLVDGVAQPQYRWHGTRYLPVKRMGCDYIIRIRNDGDRRIEAVLSVDGLSVINGRRASEDIRGYLVPAHSSIEIPGWRRGDEKVAAFNFSHYEKSYAYQTGRPERIGVIELTAFEERVRPQEATSSRRHRGDIQPADGFSVEGMESGKSVWSPSHRVGTGYGQELDHWVTRVPFQRGSVKHHFTIQYGQDWVIWPTKPRPDGVTHDDNFTPPPPKYSQ